MLIDPSPTHFTAHANSLALPIIASVSVMSNFGGGSAEGRAEMRNLLGGKGANLAEMSNLGLPVPPGFTITTEVCTWYYDHGETYPDGLQAQVDEGLRAIEAKVGEEDEVPQDEDEEIAVQIPTFGHRIRNYAI